MDSNDKNRVLCFRGKTEEADFASSRIEFDSPGSKKSRSDLNPLITFSIESPARSSPYTAAEFSDKVEKLGDSEAEELM